MSAIGSRQEAGAEGGLVRVLDRFSPWLVAFGLVLLWELTTELGILNAQDVSRPMDVMALVWEWTVTGYVFPHLGVTLYEVVTGYVLGTLIGLLVAFVFFFAPRVQAFFDLPVVLLNAVPRTILAPFMVLAFGYGALPKIIVVGLTVLIITLLNLTAGLRDVDRTVVNNARILGASVRGLVRHVYIPAALAWIVAAMRNSVGHAFTAAIICELIGSTSGLGWLISTGQTALRADWVMAGLFFASVVVLLTDIFILAPLERRGSHWRVF